MMAAGRAETHVQNALTALRQRDAVYEELLVAVLALWECKRLAAAWANHPQARR